MQAYTGHPRDMMIKMIPNAVTMINLFCGCLGIIYTLEGRYAWVLALVGISMIADFADGLLARALNAKSALGVQLDSLADAVSFGVLPGTILFVLIEQAVGRPFADYNEFPVRLEHLGFLFTIFAVLRLGIFNIDTRQTDHFIGLATPAATIFVVGLMVIRHYEVPVFIDWMTNEYLLIGITVALAALMNSNLPMFSFKVNGLMWKGNEERVIFLVLCVPLFLLLKWAALPAVIMLYILVSAASFLLGKKKA